MLRLAYAKADRCIRRIRLTVGKQTFQLFEWIGLQPGKKWIEGHD